MRSCVPAVMAAAAVLASALDVQAQPPARGGRGGRPQKTRESTIESAVKYLQESRAEDGTWSLETHKGITGVVLTGLLKSGKVQADDPLVAPGLAFVESLASPDEGHLANAENLFQKNYVTSVNLVALKASGNPKYEPLIARAVDYLKTVQYDEGESKSPADLEYGGFGYQAGTRPDLSNSHFALDALRAAGVSADDPVIQKTLVFVSRTQNLHSEHNQQPWAEKLNDGSFIYVLVTRRDAEPSAEVEARPGYGSMTYSGLKCLLQGNVSREDQRVEKALAWLRDNYSVDSHAGRQPGDGAAGYYYYLMSMAKGLHTLGEDTFVDADGVAHDWRAEITRALMNRQRPDGSWGNDVRNWMESNSDLDTAYALITLSYAKPKE